jgi:pimeloyl-ACP methyl ester carboxylesterase
MPELRVNSVDLSYIDDGVGTPVVFVHGAWMDLRYWEPQRERVAAHHRFVAYTLRYHGTAPWPDDGKNYSAATHAADLAGFVHQLNAGPVHLVGLSMGGRLAMMVALEHPDLLRSLTVLEPPLHDLLDELPEAQAARDDWRRGFEALRMKAQAGDAIGATRLFYELVNDQGPGALDVQPEPFRQMVLDNARTVPLALSARPPEFSRAILNDVKSPTLVVRGEQSPPSFAWINGLIAQGIPGSRLVVIPKAAHLMSYQNPAAFNEALLCFLAQQ